MRGNAVPAAAAGTGTGSDLATGGGATLELERAGGLLSVLGLDCTWSCLLGILLSTLDCLSCPPTLLFPAECVDIRLKLVLDESTMGSETACFGWPSRPGWWVVVAKRAYSGGSAEGARGPGAETTGFES